MKTKKRRLAIWAAIGLLCGCFSSTQVAQGYEPDVEWEKTFGGSGEDNSRMVRQTTDGGYILVGTTGSYGAGDRDVYLVKADSNGNEVWNKTFGGGSRDAGHCVQQTSDGGYIVAGYFNWQQNACLIKTDSNGNEVWHKCFGEAWANIFFSVQQTLDGGYIASGMTSTSGAGGYDGCLAKIDSDGNEVWYKTYGGSANEYLYSVQQTTDGGYIVVGDTRSFGANGMDVYLIKTDSDGNEVWHNTFGGSGDDDGYWVQQTTDGGYIITGIVNYQTGSDDIYLIKTDSDGNTVWEKTFGGSSVEHGQEVNQTSDGGYIVAGYTTSFGAGDYDAYLIKTNSAGNLEWYKTFGGPLFDVFTSVQQTSDGGYIAAGLTNSFDASNYDAYLIKLRCRPVANAGPDQLVQCACNMGGTRVKLDGTGSHSPSGGPLTYTWTGPFEGGTASGPNPTVKLLPGCDGTYETSLVVSNGEMDSAPDTVVITVEDTTPPTITCAAPITVEAQGADGVPVTDLAIQSFLGEVSASDNCDPSPLVGDDAPGDFFGLGPTTVTFTATDWWGNAASCQSVATVVDTTPPDITIVAPQAYGLYAAGGLTLDFSAYDLVSGPIQPPDLSATLTDGGGFSGPVAPGDEPGAGVYTLDVTAIDKANNDAHGSVLFVVYDPTGGFATGGGWIDSPQGAYAPDLSLTGKANFGFVSKYKKGATVPTGQTEFVFQTADLNFHSGSYDWLVVTGSNYARFKGTGTINGSGAYKFMLWAGDEAFAGLDTFRIRIWEEDELANEMVVYDNGFNQAVGGGSIVVHTK